jgi:60S ribosome biogenesis protein Rrp14
MAQQARLRDDSNAFKGLMALIPAKEYHGEDITVRLLMAV